MKLSELLADIPSDDMLRELFPYDRMFNRCSLKTRPCVTHRELVFLSLWYQGYTQKAIGNHFGITGSCARSQMHHALFRLPRLAVVMDMERTAPPVRKDDPIIDHENSTAHADALWKSRQPVATEQDLLTMASYKNPKTDTDGYLHLIPTKAWKFWDSTQFTHNDAMALLYCLCDAVQYLSQREPPPENMEPKLEETADGTSD